MDVEAAREYELDQGQEQHQLGSDSDDDDGEGEAVKDTQNTSRPRAEYPVEDLPDSGRRLL